MPNYCSHAEDTINNSNAAIRGIIRVSESVTRAIYLGNSDKHYHRIHIQIHVSEGCNAIRYMIWCHFRAKQMLTIYSGVIKPHSLTHYKLLMKVHLKSNIWVGID